MQPLTQVIFAQEGGVVSLTLNRPERRNAITTVMLAELIFALEQCAQDGSVRVVVVRGADHGFCPGDDLRGMGPLPEDCCVSLHHNMDRGGECSRNV